MSAHGSGHGHDHEHTLCDQSPQKRQGKLPVTILTGYLGAGKTTLLNYLLREQKDKKIAVIENEVGEVSVDDALVEQRSQESVAQMVVLDNGCVCCTIRDDLATTLVDIAKSGLLLDGVIVELTGMADPAPVVQTFFVHDEVRQAFAVDNVVTLVDAKHAIQKLDESQSDPEGKGTAAAQIVFSSSVLLNKIDLVDSKELLKIEGRIKQLNSMVEIIQCQNAVVPVDRIVDVGAFHLGKALEEQYMDEEEFNTFYKSKMDKSVSNVGIRCPGAVNIHLFQRMLHTHTGTPEGAMDFLRVKAVLNIAGSDNKFVLQGVHMLKNQGFTVPWAEAETRENRIIFIGRGMEARRGQLIHDFNQCIDQPLRFEIGDDVQAKVGPGEDEYANGHIIAQYDGTQAYTIRLLDDEDVYAPVDDDYFVRAGHR